MTDRNVKEIPLLDEYEDRSRAAATSQWDNYYTMHVSANAQRHRKIRDELGTIYAAKNADYGDAFHRTFLEEGMAMPRIRLMDKFERFKQLTRRGSRRVADESIRDTLMDLANYAIMTVMELDQLEGGGERR